MLILLIPFENIEKEILEHLKEKISETFKVKILVTKQNPLPLCKKREMQLNASDFLPTISALANSKNADTALGITEEDLYVPELNFVFGLASQNSCIISLARLKNSNKKLFLKRASKEAIHEIGHLYGLEHCSNSRCVMHFSNCLADTDYKQEEFCVKCRTFLKLK